MQGTLECIYTTRANPANKMGLSCHTSKKNAPAQVSLSYPLAIGGVYRTTACMQGKCACQFSLRDLCDLDILL